jgi:hypothetical protein
MSCDCVLTDHMLRLESGVPVVLAVSRSGLGADDRVRARRARERFHRSVGAGED